MLRFFLESIKVLLFRKNYFYWNLRKILGFSPLRLQYYSTALTHKSYSVKNNNERLEFLGDAILDAVIAEYLFKIYKEEDEGFMTNMRSKIVRGEKLSDIALLLGLDKLIRIRNAQLRKNILEDAMEAFIGAIYMDKGYWRAKRFILKKIIAKHIDIEKLQELDENFKSQLIELAQSRKLSVQFYTDADHEVQNAFISYVRIGDKVYDSGMGSSKKDAEQEAAKNTLINYFDKKIT